MRVKGVGAKPSFTRGQDIFPDQPKCAEVLPLGKYSHNDLVSLCESLQREVERVKNEMYGMERVIRIWTRQ